MFIIPCFCVSCAGMPQTSRTRSSVAKDTQKLFIRKIDSDIIALLPRWLHWEELWPVEEEENTRPMEAKVFCNGFQFIFVWFFLQYKSWKILKITELKECSDGLYGGNEGKRKIEMMLMSPTWVKTLKFTEIRHRAVSLQLQPCSFSEHYSLFQTWQVRT